MPRAMDDGTRAYQTLDCIISHTTEHEHEWLHNINDDWHLISE